jgi:hypothetical protein
MFQPNNVFISLSSQAEAIILGTTKMSDGNSFLSDIKSSVDLELMFREHMFKFIR